MLFDTKIYSDLTNGRVDNVKIDIQCNKFLEVELVYIPYDLYYIQTVIFLEVNWYVGMTCKVTGVQVWINRILKTNERT